MSEKITPKDVRMHIAVHRKIEKAALAQMAKPKRTRKSRDNNNLTHDNILNLGSKRYG